jgi:hypothetical protein
MRHQHPEAAATMTQYVGLDVSMREKSSPATDRVEAAKLLGLGKESTVRSADHFTYCFHHSGYQLRLANGVFSLRVSSLTNWRLWNEFQAVTLPVELRFEARRLDRNV